MGGGENWAWHGHVQRLHGATVHIAHITKNGCRRRRG